MRERVLISMKSYIGDAVMAAPLIVQLNARHGQVHILTSGLVDQVLAGPEREFLMPPKASSLGAILRLSNEIRKHQFTSVVLVNQSFRSALVAKLARIPVRIGFPTEGRRILLSHSLPLYPREFQAQSYLRLGQPLGAELEPFHPNLVLTAEERSIRNSSATVAVQPGARYEAKRIPLTVTQTIIRALQEKGEQVVLFGGPDERESAREILSEVPGVESWVGDLTIRQTLSRLANLKLAIGADTGAMHLAAAVNCPTVTVFGPTESRKWGHNYEPHRVVKAPLGQMPLVTPDAILEHSTDLLGKIRLTLA
jgi:heptosyltransferase II